MQNQTIKHAPTAQDAHLPLTQEIMSAALHVAELAAASGKLGEELTVVKRCLLAASDIAREMESRVTVSERVYFHTYTFKVPECLLASPDFPAPENRTFSILSRSAVHPPLVYLAAPYTHERPQERQMRFELATRCAAWLMACGIAVFSPLTHGHPVSELTHTYAHHHWDAVNDRLLSACDAVLVLDLPATEASEGVRREVELARRLGLPPQLITATAPGVYNTTTLPVDVWGWDGISEPCHDRF